MTDFVLSNDDEESKESVWAPLLKAVGLPTETQEITEDMESDITSMSINEFREYVKVPGPTPGYEFPGVCLAGSAVLGWVTGKQSHDHDYFPVDIEAAQGFADFLIKKHYKLTGYQGAHDVMDIELGEGKEWMPDPTDIASWYGWLGCSLGANTPGPLDPLSDLPPEELVRALNFKRNGDPIPRQIVLVIRGTPREVIDTFDFSVSQWAIYDRRIYWGKYTIPTMVRKRVRINRIHHPMSTMRRMIKYADKGYYFCTGTMLQIARGLAHFADTREEAGLEPLGEQPISLD